MHFLSQSQSSFLPEVPFCLCQVSPLHNRPKVSTVISIEIIKLNEVCVMLCLTVIETSPSEKASKLRIKHLALEEVNYIGDDC